MSKAKPFNGYPSWASWNVCLWIDNDYDLYMACRYVMRMFSIKEITRKQAVRDIQEITRSWFGKNRTNDGAYISLKACDIWLSNQLEG